VAAYYFEGTPSRAIVLRKDVELPDKVGVHLTWDAIFVTLQTANAFRNHLVTTLRAACPDVDWKDVVDGSVYAGSGLRMPWSAKKNAPGVYRPVATCTPDGTTDAIPAIETASDLRNWVRATSIRAPGESPTPTCVVTSSEDGEPEPDLKRCGKSVTESLLNNAEVLAKIHATLPKQYEQQKFTGMHRYGDFCVVLRSSSKRCGNKGFQEHQTNTVYFVVLRKGYAYQRCYCRKETVRDAGVTCAEYMGEPWAVPPEIIDALWPPLPKETSILKRMLEQTRPALKKKARNN